MALAVMGSRVDPEPPPTSVGGSRGPAAIEAPTTPVATTPDLNKAWPFPGVPRSALDEILQQAVPMLEGSGMSKQMYANFAQDEGSWNDAQVEYIVENTNVNWRQEAVYAAELLVVDSPDSTRRELRAVLLTVGHTPDDIDYALNQVWGG